MKDAQIKLVCQKLLEVLHQKKLIILKKSDTECLQKMVEIFTKDLKVEDEINKEAERLLEHYTRTMGDKIDREKMFQMIKKQLIKDKGVVV